MAEAALEGSCTLPLDFSDSFFATKLATSRIGEPHVIASTPPITMIV
jgi:hypothetical protein